MFPTSTRDLLSMKLSITYIKLIFTAYYIEKSKCKTAIVEFQKEKIVDRKFEIYIKIWRSEMEIQMSSLFNKISNSKTDKANCRPYFL